MADFFSIKEFISAFKKPISDLSLQLWGFGQIISGNMGFDGLFVLLSIGAALILCSVVMLPRLRAITMPVN